MAQKRARLVRGKTMFKGSVFGVRRDSVIEPDGLRATREIVTHSGSVVVMPVFLNGDLLLVRQYRYAAGQALWELVAGRKEPSESPLAGARRELLEETGYLAGRLKRIGAFYSSPGILNEKLYAFSAYDLEKKESALEEDEEIEIMPVLFDDALKMIDHAEIMDAKTIATLLMYERAHRATT